MPGLSDALLSLRPGAVWTCGNTYESISWMSNDIVKPTEQEVTDEINRLNIEYQNNEYQRLREKEYPTFGEQFDLLYHQGYDGWKTVITAVKNKYPKPV
jgi:hypothetical protein